MKIELWLAFKYIFKNRVKHISFISAISYSGIALGVCALIVVLAVMNGFDSNLTEKLTGFNFHIITEGDNLTKRDLEAIRRMPGVKNAVLFARVQTAVKSKDIILPAVFENIDFNTQERAVWKKHLLKGNFEGVVLGNILAQNLGVKAGQSLKIFNPENFKPEEFKISGIFSFGIYDIDSGFIISGYPKAETFLSKTKQNLNIGIRLQDVYSSQKIKAEIISMFPDKIISIQTWDEMNRILFSALKLEKFVMFLILSLIILVASFNIFSTQTVRVVEKIKDIGILKSLGMTKRSIYLIFSLQGVLLGSIGIFLGSSGGIILSLLLKKYHFIKIPSEIYYINYLPVLLNYRDVIWICVIALIMSILFSLFPGIKASRIRESDALRYE